MTIPNEEFDFIYKIVLVGDTAVGKTNLVSRYLKNTQPKNSNPTIGVEFSTRAFTLKSGITIKAQIWDTAGQERYHAIVSAHYRRAIGALAVYDVTSFKSFCSISRWLNELKDKADPSILIILVGNKIDLLYKNPALREVSSEHAKKFADEEGLLFIETSALIGTKVSEAFEILIEGIYEKTKDRIIDDEKEGITKSLAQIEPKNRRCC
ncbi:unnamed protein product [Blepharisma stoltei]|uniref:Uncharacterized protein n=1 Tax=Blepharisma stoltei TaxID=1481888 RepID=A0AAU9J4B9_9CILI|nr:unnamed protein product [Blepharisma stoltei]